MVSCNSWPLQMAPNCQPLWYGCNAQSHKYKIVQELHKIAHVTVTARRLHKLKSGLLSLVCHRRACGHALTKTARLQDPFCLDTEQRCRSRHGQCTATARPARRWSMSTFHSGTRMWSVDFLDVLATHGRSASQPPTLARCNLVSLSCPQQPPNPRELPPHRECPLQSGSNAKLSCS